MVFKDHLGTSGFDPNFAYLSWDVEATATALP